MSQKHMFYWDTPMSYEVEKVIDISWPYMARKLSTIVLQTLVDLLFVALIAPIQE